MQTSNLYQASNFKWANLVDKSVKFLSLNICYVLYVLFVNKILAHVIWKSYSFHFIQFKKLPNISGIRVGYSFMKCINSTFFVLKNTVIYIRKTKHFNLKQNTKQYKWNNTK